MPGILKCVEINSEDYLADLPHGPLDSYRRAASFNWKVLKCLIEDEKVLRFKYKIWKTLERDPLFARSPTTPTLEEARKIAMERALRVFDYDFLPTDDFIADPRLTIALTVALGQYDWTLGIKWVVMTDFFTNAIRGLGTTGHYEYLERAAEVQCLGCLCLTEISHGTDTRAMRTRATYDPTQGKYILHTPDFEAAKCWAGNLGKTATHAVVFAQLYTPDGQCHGLHAFVVPIRDPKNMVPFPGITIGDMGSKLGLNGLDNGYMLFDHFPIAREALLNKTGSVTPEGQYVTPFKDPNKKFGASLGNLSAGRVSIINQSVGILCNAIPIAVRYSAVRRQFGTEGQEFPVIEYQMQQWRLFPYIAATFVLKNFGDLLFQNYVNFVLGQYTDGDKSAAATLGAEIHAISSSGKPLASWLARDAAQECREACGGHGYLRSAGIGQLRDDNDPNCTYEGDNNVLLQQTSNWLLSIWGNPNRESLNSPMGSIKFLANSREIQMKKFRAKSVQDLMNPALLLEAYQWLVCWLLQSTADKFHSSVHSGKDLFSARNDSQVYQARTLSLAYIEHFVLDQFHQLSTNPENPPGIQSVLRKLLLLYGYWSLEKHLAILYQGGYAEGVLPAKLIREVILELCLILKGEAVALVDVIAPPDFVLNSVLGMSDGQVYKHLQASMGQTPGGFERPDWWQSVAKRLQAKL